MAETIDYQELVKQYDPQLHRMVRGSIGLMPDIRPFCSEPVRASLSSWDDQLRWRYLYDDLLALSSAEQRAELPTTQMLRWLAGETSIDSCEQQNMEQNGDENQDSNSVIENVRLPHIIRSEFVFITYPAFTHLMCITSERMLQYTIMSGNTIRVKMTPKKATSLLIYAKTLDEVRYLLKLAGKRLEDQRKTLIRRAGLVRNAELIGLLTNFQYKDQETCQLGADNIIARELIFAAKKNDGDLFGFFLPFGRKNDLVKTILNANVILNHSLLTKILERFTPPQYVLNIALRLAIRENNIKSFRLLVAIPQAKSVEYAILPLILSLDRFEFLESFLGAGIRCSANILAQVLIDHRRETEIATRLLNAHLDHLDVDGAMEVILECSRRPETISYARRTLCHHRDIIVDILDGETYYRLLYLNDG